MLQLAGCRNLLFYVLIIFCWNFSPLNSAAQDNTLYLIPEIPQANQLNPAYFRLCRVYVELPVIASMRINIRNTGFGFHDVIEPGTGAESDIYFISLPKLEKHLKKINYSQVSTDVNLLGFGFGLKEWYLTFGIQNHSDGLLTYPQNLLLIKDERLMATSQLNKPVDLSSLGSEVTIWNSIGLSAAREIGQGLKIGIRVKYLQGMANAITRHTSFLVNPIADPVGLQGNLRSDLNSSFPVIVGFHPSGMVNRLDFNNWLDNFAGDYIFNRNRGVSFDAGVVYDYNDKTEISASITDLGFIRWKKNSNRFRSSGAFFFSDTTLLRFRAIDGNINLIRAVRDSVSASVTSASKPYTTLTPIKLFGGVTRVISPNLRAGAMTRIEIYDLHIMPSFTLSLNYTPVAFLAASVSYTMMNNKFNQVGAGIALGNRVVQFYLTADNIPVRYQKDNVSALFWPYNARMFSLHTGINLLFGCRDKVKSHGPRKFKGQDYCPAYD
jgi:hypothetical protein